MRSMKERIVDYLYKVNDRIRYRRPEYDFPLLPESVLIGIAGGTLTGFAFYQQVYKRIFEDGYTNTQQVKGLTQTILGKIGEENLTGDSPETVLNNLDGINAILASERSVLQQQGVNVQTLASKLQPIKQQAQQFAEGYPGNSTDWFNWLYGGTNGTIGARYTTNDAITNFTTEIRNVREQAASYQTNLNFWGFTTTVVVGAAAIVLLAITAERGLKKAGKRIHQRASSSPL